MLRFTWVAFIFALSACDDGTDAAAADGGAADGGAADGAPTAAPTWSDEVGAIVAANCAGCHREGGAAPFPLDRYEAAAPLAGAMAAAVSAGRMPPWNPGPDCREYVGQRILAAADVAAIEAWAAAGAPQGAGAAEAPPPPPTVDFEPNVVAKASEAYLPDVNLPDDYRCLVLDAEFPEGTFVQGFEVVPDQGALVHHVLLYAIPAADRAAVEALDDAADGAGYPCFGGVGVGIPMSQGGWVPGAHASVWAGDRASYIPAGGKLVMQVHYNLTAAAPAPDQTAVRLMTRTTPPAEVVAGQPLATLDLEIPAGEPESTMTREFTWYGDEPLNIVGIAPHMHLLGTRIAVEIVHRGAGEECLVQIPQWDFSWQELFILAEPATVMPGDALRLRCTYDNSAANQPVVNGAQLTPRDIAWGEGTLDEMCFSNIIVAKPWDPALADAPRCAGVAGCMADCDDFDSLNCVARCVGSDRGCGQCLIGALAQCSAATCLAQLEGARACLTHCVSFGGDPDACMTDFCPAEYAAVDACVSAATADGECHADLVACL